MKLLTCTQFILCLILASCSSEEKKPVTTSNVENKESSNTAVKTIQTFVERFNKNESLQLETLSDINNFENKFRIKLPQDYKDLLLNYGNVFTPNILDIVVDTKSPLQALQEFWTIEHIEYDKENEWTSKLEEDLIPFAMDCSGNLFCFKTSELKKSENSASVYFYDHDFDTIEKVADTFVDFISEYNKLK